jgi:glycerol-3-phosphate cytidylyltransferase-like family protein
MKYAPTYCDHINSPVTREKILTLEQVRDLSEKEDITRVLNVGSYDFPQHLGHTNVLEWSKHIVRLTSMYHKEYGDLLEKFGSNILRPEKIFLLVAMNSDESYRKLDEAYRVNGKRKIASHSEGERVRQIANLQVVDGIVLFDDERAIDIIETYRPHIFTKGGDYVIDPKDATEERIPIDQLERKVAESFGSIIKVMPLGVDINGVSHHSYHHLRFLAEKHGFTNGE